MVVGTPITTTVAGKIDTQHVGMTMAMKSQDCRVPGVRILRRTVDKHEFDRTGAPTKCRYGSGRRL